jgi:hypothetical protein
MKKRIVRIKLKDIKTDPVGDMLVEGDTLKPYIDHYCALMTGRNSDQTLKVIAALPEEKRYLFRVVQCLDWELADCDSETAKLDMPYVTDLAEVTQKLHLRLMQLADLLRALKGIDEQ